MSKYHKIFSILVAIVLVLTLSLLGFSQKKRSSKKNKNQPRKNLSEKVSEVKRFVIPLDVPKDKPETETRALISFINDRQEVLLFRMESPFYRVESSIGMMGMSSASWSPGAEHVYSGQSETVNNTESSSGKKVRVLEDGRMVMIIDRGSMMEINKISGWEIKSETDYPLTFKVVKDVGYVYMYGRGQVKSPTGQVEKLGQTDTVDKWIKKLADPDPFNRESAAQALGWLGNSKAVPDLCKVLGDSTPLVRRSAAESLGRIGDVSAIEALQSASQDKHAWTSATIKWALEKFETSKETP